MCQNHVQQCKSYICLPLCICTGLAICIFKVAENSFFHISTNVIIRWQKLSNERDNIVDVKNIYEMKRFSIVNYSCKIKSTIWLRVGENLAYVILKKCAKFRR